MKKVSLSQVLILSITLAIASSAFLVTIFQYEESEKSLKQLEIEISSSSKEWLNQEMTELRTLFSLKYQEIIQINHLYLEEITDSELVLSLMWKKQYEALQSVLIQYAKESDNRHYFVSDLSGNVLSSSTASDNAYVKVYNSLQDKSLHTQLVSLVKGEIFRVNRHLIKNIFDDELGIIYSVSSFENENKQIADFARTLGIGYQFSYESESIGGYRYPKASTYTSLALKKENEISETSCLPFKSSGAGAMSLCIVKPVLLITKLTTKIKTSFLEARERMLSNTLLLASIVLVSLLFILFLFNKVIFRPVQQITTAFREIGEPMSKPLVMSSFISEIEQLIFALRKVRVLFSDNEKLKEQHKEDSLHDALTGLPNRRLFEDRGQLAIAQASREQHEVVLLLIDLDKFKTVNDTFGHDVGDDLLCQITKRLKQNIRSYNTLARWGGDEFLMLAPNLHKENYEDLISQITDVFKEPFIIDNQEHSMNVSIGLAAFPRDGVSLKDLLIAADIAMYEAKTHPNTSFHLFKKGNAEKSHRRLALEKALKNSIEQGELYLCFQPIASVNALEISHAETLVRWHSPIFGEVYPDEFIPIAERIGFIATLGNWVRDSAIEQQLVWEKEYGIDIKLTVNVSSIELDNIAFADNFIEAVSTANLPSHRIIIEITESTIINDFDLVKAHLCKLADYGIKWALDDFGTGYSSLHYLANLTPDYLKLDRSLIIGIENNDRVENIVKGVIQLSQSLDIKVISEGVEEVEQRQLLDDFKCDYLQGYWFARPMKKDQFIEFFQTHEERK